MIPISNLSYQERAGYCLSPLSKRLFELLDEKQTNLALSADVTRAEALLELADNLGPHICILKTHIDIIEDFSHELTHDLHKLSIKHNFLLFEDRKFADIGNTVKHQYADGIYQIANWADLVNAHTLPGPGIVKGLAEIGRRKNRGLLMIAQMSCDGHLLDEIYVKNTLNLAEKYSDFVVGFISQRALSRDPHWIYLTPGVKLEKEGDTLGQAYITPEKAILENGSDIIIVGRGILKANDVVTAAKHYRQLGWDAYLKRLSL